MLYYAGDSDNAADELSAALQLIPPTSPYYDPTLQNLYTAMTASDDVPTLRKAVRRLRAIPDTWKGLKRVTQQRAKLAWTTGQGLAKLADLDKTLSAAARRSLLEEAARYLRLAVDSLTLLRLPLDLMACRADLSAVMVMLEPSSVRLVLGEEEPPGLGATVTAALADARTAAEDALTPSAFATLCASLWTLRESTTEAGASPPLLSYAFA
jgi:hypothetical protein